MAITNESEVCGSTIDCDECDHMMPSMCGNANPVTMTSCDANQIIPQVDCIVMELEAPKCE